MHIKSKATFIFKMDTKMRAVSSVIECAATAKGQGQQVF